VAHRMMDRRMRRRCDPVDISQRAWKSFFVRIIHEMTFDSEEDLRRYLEAVAHNKSLQARRENLSTAKRDVRREVSLDDPTREAVVVLADPQPTPDQLAESEEWWQQWLARLPSDRYRECARRWREGCPDAVLEEEFGIVARTIARMVSRSGRLRAQRPCESPDTC